MKRPKHKRTRSARPSQLNLDLFATQIDERMRREQLKLRHVSEQCGVSFGQLSKIRRGKCKPDLDSFISLVRWLGVPAEQFIKGSPHPSEKNNASEEPLIVHLRAERKLPTEIVNALVTMVKLAYSSPIGLHPPKE